MQISGQKHKSKSRQYQQLRLCKYQVRNDRRICTSINGWADTRQSASGAGRSGCEKVFSEKVSGAKTDRAQLAKAIATLVEGDTLIVCKLDRLARSTRDLLNTLAAIADAGASFKSLGDPWCDTTSAHGRLMLTVLGGLAEFERYLILARTSEGRTRAKEGQWRSVG